MNHSTHRRQFLQGLAGIGLGAALPHGQAVAANPNRILVVVELTSANDGFNTLVPFADDAYYRLRPKLGIRANKLRKIDDVVLKTKKNTHLNEIKETKFN
jgi:uncharacterized protein (DUF1501 family)